jgi:hypothetical protein
VTAEFAKEALHKQTLAGSSLGEALSIRWSNEDPNPASMVFHKRMCEEAFADAAFDAWDALPPEVKRQRIQTLQMEAALKKGCVVASYPNTDGQYGSAPAPAEQDHDTDGQYCSTSAPAEQYPDTDGQYAYPDTDGQYSGQAAPHSLQEYPPSAPSADASTSGAQDVDPAVAAAWQAYYAQFQTPYASGYGYEGASLNPEGPSGTTQGSEHNALGLLAGYGTSDSDGDG